MTDRVVMFKDDRGDWRWNRIAPNNEIVSDSSEGYENRTDARDAAIRVNALPFVLECEGFVNQEFVEEEPPLVPVDIDPVDLDPEEPEYKYDDD